MNPTFNTVEEYQAYCDEQAEIRNNAIMFVIGNKTEETTQSDKIGQLFKVVKLGEFEVRREYVPDPDYNPDEPDGTYLKPFQFTAPMQVALGKFYTDGEDIWECVQAGVADAFTAPWFYVIEV